MFCGFNRISRPMKIGANIMTQWLSEASSYMRMENSQWQAFIGDHYWLLQGNDAMLLSEFNQSLCCFLYIDHTVYKCTICPVLTALNLPSEIFLTVMKNCLTVKMRGGISVWLCNVFVIWFGENVRPVSVCACFPLPYLHWTGISHCLLRTSTTFKSLRATRVMHMTINLHPLPCCVCVCLCLAMSWLVSAVTSTAEWCAARFEDWEPINTLPFFTPHIWFMLIV